MKLVPLVMALTVISSAATLAWAAGFDPRKLDLQIWWNLGLIGAAVISVGLFRLRRTRSE